MGDELAGIDWEQLDMIADGYTPDFVEIYREFIEQTPALFGTLEEQLHDGDASGAHQTAHKIKGSSANFGFVGVCGPMSQVEMRAKIEKTLEGADELAREACENFEAAKALVRAQRGI